MIRVLKYLSLVLIVAGCSNTSELEEGEIKTFQIIKDALNNLNQPTVSLDARTLISRKKIDKIGIPVLFVELDTGQNGTLTQYPGKGPGQTWLGADGATLTLQKGVLKATRGMGDDLMGYRSNKPTWLEINDVVDYKKLLTYLSGNNEIYIEDLNCQITKEDNSRKLKIWGTLFTTTKFEEVCFNNTIVTKNSYHIDTSGLVRKSFQYHSEALGYITIERLDRLR